MSEHTYDPDDAHATEDFLGIPISRDEASIIAIPVPFDATCSYRPGTARGPQAIKEASWQIDLADHRFGEIWRKGIFMEPIPDEIAALSTTARAAYEAEDTAAVNQATDTALAHVRARAKQALDESKVPALIGGEHSVSLGAILACAARNPGMGILQLDAHMDLRDAYEGITLSHASVMKNALDREPGIASLTQIGIRDYGAKERKAADADPRIETHYADDLHDRALSGESWRDILSACIASLPQTMYITLDIDAFDPDLCPNTGTPVPGGLSWPQFSLLLSMLKDSGRKIAGFDVVEVSPGNATVPGDTIDAIVGARAFYRLCALT